VADEESVPVENRRAGLAAWRADIGRACEGAAPLFPVNQELQPFIREHRLRFELFDELIKGCEMDLDTSRYETHEELELYCHRVASVVGLLSIEIFGYRNPACREYAVHLGKALQLTNILRDVRIDAERGRIYLPLAELKQFNVTEAEILPPAWCGSFAHALREGGRISELPVSREHASRQFHRHYGLSPRAYRAEWRMRRALRLLGDGAGLAAVAADAGYADQSHLTRELRSKTGMTPKNLREHAGTSHTF